MEPTKKKKHADFQDPYRRSSNFRRIIPKEEFVIDDEGDLHLDDKKDTYSS